MQENRLDQWDSFASNTVMGLEACSVRLLLACVGKVLQVMSLVIMCQSCHHVSKNQILVFKCSKSKSEFLGAVFRDLPCSPF